MLCPTSRSHSKLEKNPPSTRFTHTSNRFPRGAEAIEDARVCCLPAGPAARKETNCPGSKSKFSSSGTVNSRWKHAAGFDNRILRVRRAEWVGRDNLRPLG